MRLAIDRFDPMKTRFQQVVDTYDLKKAGLEGKKRFKEFEKILNDEEVQNPITLLGNVCSFYKDQNFTSKLVKNIRLALLDIFGIADRTETVNAGSRTVTVNVADSELDQRIKQLETIEMVEYSSPSFSR